MNNPFAWQAQPMECDWSGIRRSASNSTASTATVARKRKTGEDPGAVLGMSVKGDSLIDAFSQQKHHGGAWSKAKAS